MSQINTREILLFQGTATTSGAGPDINAIQGWQAAIVTVTATTVSGTTPTLALFVQNKIGQAATTDLSGGFLTGTGIYDDFMAFTSIIAAGVRIMRPVTGPLVSTANATTVTTADYAQLDGTLTAGSVRVGPIGGLWRVKFVLGGTTPSFGFAVTAQLIPFST